MSCRYLTYKYAIYKRPILALTSRQVMTYGKRYAFKLKDPNALRDVIFRNVLLQGTLF